MKNILKKAGILSIALIMVAAAGGFTIYQHYCGCAATACCSQHEQEEPKQPPVTDNCCSAQGNPSGEPCPASSCCYTSNIFMKIDEFINTSFEQVSFKLVITLLKIIGNEEFSRHDKNIIDKESYFQGELPPLLTGKEKILAYHQVKIAPPLS